MTSNKQNNVSASSEAMREAIQNIAVGPDRGRDITRHLAQQVLSGVLAGELDEVQTAVFFIALRMKRESIDEFLGLFEALTLNSHTEVASADDVICLADPFDGYVRTVTMTPFLPAVLAACGHTAVIHGVETVGPKHGVTASKVYQAAGLPVDCQAKDIASRLTASAWAYVDQSCYAPSLFKLQSLRDKIIKRTALTTLERLILPIRGAQASHLVLGYVHKAYPSIYATVAKAAGYNSVLLLKGVEGGLAPALNKPLRRFVFDSDLPDDIDAQKQLIESQSLFGSPVAALQVNSETLVETDFYAKDPVQTCLNVGLEVLDGSKNSVTQAARDSLCLSAANILIAHETNLSLPSAVEKVQMCLDNGSAKHCFESFS